MGAVSSCVGIKKTTDKKSGGKKGGKEPVSPPPASAPQASSSSKQVEPGVTVKIPAPELKVSVNVQKPDATDGTSKNVPAEKTDAPKLKAQAPDKSEKYASALETTAATGTASTNLTVTGTAGGTKVTTTESTNEFGGGSVSTKEVRRETRNIGGSKSLVVVETTTTTTSRSSMPPKRVVTSSTTGAGAAAGADADEEDVIAAHELLAAAQLAAQNRGDQVVPVEHVEHVTHETVTTTVERTQPVEKSKQEDKVQATVEPEHKFGASGGIGISTSGTRISVEAAHANELLLMAQMAAEESRE